MCSGGEWGLIGLFILILMCLSPGVGSLDLLSILMPDQRQFCVLWTHNAFSISQEHVEIFCICFD